MTEPPPERPALARVLRRLLPLALLGSAVALVAVQVSRAVAHEVTVWVTLAPGAGKDLRELQLEVTGEDGEMASVAVFRFGPARPPDADMKHVLNLTSGDYGVTFKLHRTGSEPERIRRNLTVDADAVVRFQVP